MSLPEKVLNITQSANSQKIFNCSISAWEKSAYTYAKIVFVKSNELSLELSTK